MREGLAAIALVLIARAGRPRVGPAARPRDLRRLSPSRGYPKSTSAAVAVDLTTGKPLFARNPDLSLAPASNEKLPVTFAALRDWEPRIDFATDVLGRGHQNGTTWQGDIFLKGFGDPTLTSAAIESARRPARARGITRIAGRVLGDESWFDARRTAPGWKSAFYISESPPLSALVVDRAVYDGHVALRPALAAAGRLRRAPARGTASRAAPPARTAPAGALAARARSTRPAAGDPPGDGPRERQLHRGADAEGARRRESGRAARRRPAPGS